MSEPTTPEKLSALERRMTFLETNTVTEIGALTDRVRAVDLTVTIVCGMIGCLAVLVWIVARKLPIAVAS